MVLPRLPITKALVSMLADGTSKPVGLGRVPRLDETSLHEPPYAIVYPLDAGYDGAPFGDDHEDATLLYQVTLVARRLDQLEWLGDRVRSTLVGKTSTGQYLTPFPEPAGVAITARRFDSSGGVDSQGTIVSLAETYTLSATPRS